MKTLEETILEFLENRSYLQFGIIEPLELPEIETLEIEPLPLCGGEPQLLTKSVWYGSNSKTKEIRILLQEGEGVD